MIIEIELVRGRDHEVVAGVCCGLEDVRPIPAPPLDDDALWRLRFHLLVPGHRPLAEPFYNPDDLASEIGLYLLVGIQALLGLEPVYVGHAFPHLVTDFVTGEIEVRAWEQP